LTDPDDAAIVRTIIGLAKNLRLSVVAEGVEEKGQQQFLKENGCDIIQGYELSKPLPYADMLAFLKDAAT
jgi:EAL domain-containing protein (putative c-di-GMP-specific phosphodiesterase class I)